MKASTYKASSRREDNRVRKLIYDREGSRESNGGEVEVERSGTKSCIYEGA